MITVNDEKVAWQKNMTVTDLLNGLEDAHPYAVVRVNDKYVSKPHFDDVEIPDNAEIYLEGMLQGRDTQSSTPVNAEMEGDFGHSTPETE